MAVSKEDILETIANMSVMDVVELISAMEEKFGVSAAAPVAELFEEIGKSAAACLGTLSAEQIVQVEFKFLCAAGCV